MKRISVPALLQSPKLSDMSACIRDKFWPYPEGLVVKADDADLQESKLLESFPDLSIKEIRKCSYAHLLYADIRCGLVHSYELNGRVTDWDLGIDSQMQYRNINGKPTLFIPPDLITNIVKCSIESVFDYWLESEDYERRRTEPAQWWIEGG